MPGGALRGRNRGRPEGKEVEFVGATGAPGIPGSLPWRPGPGEGSPHHVQLHIWTACAQQRPHALSSTAGQSLRAPRQGLRNGPEAATETAAVSSSRPGLDCQCGLGRGLLWAWVQGGVRGTHAGATKQPALSVPGPPGSQQSRSGQLGWEGRQGVQGSEVQLTCSPNSSGCPPHPQAARSQPQGGEKGIRNKPPQSSRNAEGETGPRAGCGSSGGSGCRVPDPTLIRQTARRHPSPGSSFEGHCQAGDPGAPRRRGWRRWANGRPLWLVLPGTCQILEEREGG